MASIFCGKRSTFKVDFSEVNPAKIINPLLLAAREFPNLPGARLTNETRRGKLLGPTGMGATPRLSAAPFGSCLLLSSHTTTGHP